MSVSSRKPRILFLTGAFPYPLTTGAKIRTFNLLKALAGEFDIDLLTIVGSPEEIRHVASVEAIGITVRYLHIALNSTIKKAGDAFFAFLFPTPYLTRHYILSEYRQVLDDMLSDRQYDAIHCDSISMSANLEGLDRDRLILTQHNIEQIIWAGYVEHAGSFPARFFYSNQLRKVKYLEEHLDDIYGHVVTVSEEDKRRLSSAFPKEKIVVVDNGVDPEAYSNHTNPEERHGIVFTGSLDWHPNIDALNYFAHELHPHLKKIDGEAQVSIVGRKPSTALRETLDSRDGVTVFADVPEIQPFLHNARVMMVPLRIGGGSRLKILEAMASGLPVVSTSKGCEGIPVTDGENIIIRDDPGEFAKALVDVTRDGELHARLARNGLALIQSRFSWEMVSRPLAALWKAVADA